MILEADDGIRRVLYQYLTGTGYRVHDSAIFEKDHCATLKTAVGFHGCSPSHNRIVRQRFATVRMNVGPDLGRHKHAYACLLSMLLSDNSSGSHTWRPGDRIQVVSRESKAGHRCHA